MWLQAIEIRFFGSGLHVDSTQLNRGVSPQQSCETDDRHPYAETSIPPYGVAAGFGAYAMELLRVQFWESGTLSHGLEGYGVGGGGKQLVKSQHEVHPASSQGTAWHPFAPEPVRHRKGATEPQTKPGISHCAEEHIGHAPLGVGVTGALGGSGVGGGKSEGLLVQPGTGVRMGGLVTGPLGGDGVCGASVVEGAAVVGGTAVVKKHDATSQQAAHWELAHGSAAQPPTATPDVH